MSGEHLFIGSPFDENHIPTRAKKAITPSAEVKETKAATTSESFTPDPEAEKKIVISSPEIILDKIERCFHTNHILISTE